MVLEVCAIIYAEGNAGQEYSLLLPIKVGPWMIAPHPFAKHKATRRRSFNVYWAAARRGVARFRRRKWLPGVANVFLSR